MNQQQLDEYERNTSRTAAMIRVTILEAATSLIEWGKEMGLIPDVTAEVIEQKGREE
jgi:hypothetical protein